MPDAPQVAWAERVARHPMGAVVLFVLAILEACLFPAPTEAAFVALGVAAPRRSWRFAVVAVCGSLVGAGIGYAVGATWFESLGRPLLAWAGFLDAFERVGALYRANPMLALLTSGYTPIPYVAYTISAGASGVGLGAFVLGSVVGRGVKYAVLAAVTFYAGPSVQRVFRRSTWVAVGVVVVLAVAWWVWYR